RTLCSNPAPSSPRAAIVSTADDGAPDVARPTALPSTVAYPRGGEECPTVPRSGPRSGRAGHRRWSLPVLALAAVFLLGLTAAWRWMGPRRPLTVTSLSVRHYRPLPDDPRRAEDLGLLGPGGETVRSGDDGPVAKLGLLGPIGPDGEPVL